MKKILFLFIWLLAAIAVEAQTFTYFFRGAELDYKITDEGARTCLVQGWKSGGNVIIPETVSYQDKSYTVVGIGSQAFKDCSSLSSVTIPNSVTEIGELAFSGCSSLSSVAIPNSVTEIGRSTFQDCSSLSSVAIPNSVTEIGKYAFYRCTGLSSVIIPNSVTTIGGSAFQNCSSLSSVTIPNSVTTIGEQAFSDCGNLKEIYYGAYNPVVAPDNLFPSYSGPTLYVRASALNKIYVTKPWAYFEKIETYDFSGIGLDSNSLSMYVGDSRTLNVTMDGNLSELTWTSSNPDVATVDSKGTVTALAAGEATITVSATDLDSNESVGATCAIEVKKAEIRLENSSLSMYVGDSRTLNVTVDGNLSKLTWTSSNPEVATVDGKGTVTALAAGEATITVSATDLYSNESVSATCAIEVKKAEIRLEKSSLSMYVGDSRTLNVTVDGNLSELTWTSSNPEVATVDSKGTVTALAAGEATITVSAIDLYTDKTVNTICKVKVDERGNYLLIYSYSDNSTATVIGLTAESSVGILIPDAIENDGKHYTVTGIKSSAFAGNGLLRAVTIPSTVNNIEPASFKGCSNLEIVNYNPVSVSTTNSHHLSPVFGNCPKFKDLNIGETVKEIPKYMFKTTDIETLNIPDNVTSLLSDCFADCYNLTEIRLGRGVTTIDCAAFAFGSSSDVSTKVYCNAEEISYYRGLNGGTSRYMPFINRRVSSIEFGPDVERLDDYAFSDISVDDIYCHGEIPPVVGNSSVLKSVDKSKCRLHVPVESLQLYRTANFWKDFYTILSDISGVDGIVVEDDTPMEVYNLNGLKVGESLEGLAPGLYIVRQGTSVRKVAVR